MHCCNLVAYRYHMSNCMLLLLVVVVLFTSSCDNIIVQSDAANARDSCMFHFKSGDVALRSGRSFTSSVLASLNQKDKTYSHTGVMVKEGDKWFVYHCIGGEDNPDAIMRKDEFADWCSPKYNSGYAVIRYDLGKDLLDSFVSITKQYYKDCVPFDMNFDLLSDSTLYCSEMVYKALIGATGDHTYVGSSTLFEKKYVGIDDLYKNDHAKFICRVRFK